MQPAVDVQLTQFQRILTEAVLPAVEDDVAAETLSRVVADIRKLASCWDAAIPFTRWDIDALDSVLRDLGVASDALEADHESATYEELRERQAALREALDEEIAGLPPEHEAPETWVRLLSYFRARLDADPMTNRSPALMGARR